MRRLQVGDDVVVIRGNHRGERGKVRRILPGKNAVVIEGINVVKRHMKPGPNRPGGIVEAEAPLDASKVMLVDPQTGKRTRVRARVADDKKVRVTVKSGTELPNRAAP